MSNLITNKKYLTLLFIIIASFSAFSIENVGISNLYSPYKNINPDFHNLIYENILSTFTELSGVEKRAVNLSLTEAALKKYLKIIVEKKNESSEGFNKFISETAGLDYCYFLDIYFFRQTAQKNFYDPLISEYKIELKMNVILLDVKKSSILNGDVIDIETEFVRDQTAAFSSAQSAILKKYSGILRDSNYLQKKIRVIKQKNLFVEIDSGKNDGVKSGEVYISYDYSYYNSKEIMAIKVFSVKETTSLAIILYKNSELNEENFFIKKFASNLKINLSGGFSLSDFNLGTPAVYPFASIRGIIPTGVPFFYPIINFDFNFFYRDNKFLLPFSFEGGIEGAFNLYRFEFYGGVLIGALFSPDSELNYQIDSVVVRPFILLSGIINSNISLFGEFGYRFYNENILFNEWKISLKGIYFNFGLTIVF